MRRALEPLAALLVALVAAGAALALLGADPLAAFGALVRGAFGDAHALETTALRLGPLLLIGLGVALAFRCGVWNIGGEGQLYVGALATTAVATRLLADAPGFVALPGALLAGALAGAGWAWIAGWLKLHRQVSEVLSTILLNFVGALGVAWAVNGPLQEAAASYPQSDPLAEAARLPILPGTRRVHVGIALCALLPFASAWLLFRTSAGLRLRAVGSAPDASRYAGIRPERETLRVLVLSGALAGLAGALEVSGVTGRLFANLSSGYGFTAIAVALLARLQPIAVLPAALFFAALAAGGGAMQRTAGVPAVVVKVIEAVVIFLSVGVALRRRD